MIYFFIEFRSAGPVFPVPNGPGPDTDAIRTALNAAYEAGGGVALMEAGIYELDEPIAIPGTKKDKVKQNNYGQRKVNKFLVDFNPINKSQKNCRIVFPVDKINWMKNKKKSK